MLVTRGDGQELAISREAQEEFEATPANDLCHHCKTHVFNSSFFLKLVRLWSRKRTPGEETTEYEISMRELLNACQQQKCSWCSKLTILISAVLVYEGQSYDRYEKMRQFLRSDFALKVTIVLGFDLSSLNGSFEAILSCDERRLSGTRMKYLLSTNAMDSGTLPIFPKLDDEFDMSSERCFAGINGFLHQCWNNHQKPVKDSSLMVTANQYPSRLIRLDPSSSPCIVLTEENDFDGRYVTLSYVWGQGQSYVLSQSTYDSKSSGIEMELLPTVIRDAIMVTERLGFRYLWVDALCIVQDDDVDKEKEISKMHAIYKNASLTIVAACSSSAWDGVLKTSQPIRYNEEEIACSFVVPVAVSELDTVNVCFRPVYHYSPTDDPIHKRAWTLQEHLMCQHMVLFSQHGVELVCRELQRYNASKVEYGPYASIHSLAQTITFDFAGSPRDQWFALRENYSRRLLSNGNDKLLALSALARQMSTHIEGRYLAGLWEHDLLANLGWYVYLGPSADREPRARVYPRPSGYRAPSWSWASVDGRISQCSGLDDGDQIFANCRIGNRKVTLSSSENPFGAVSGGFLELIGRNHESEIEKAVEPHSESTHHLIGNHNACYIYLDAEEPDLDSAKVIFVGVSVNLPNGPSWSGHIGGLILCAAGNDCYRRVGVFEKIHPSFFDGCREGKFTII